MQWSDTTSEGSLMRSQVHEKHAIGVIITEFGCHLQAQGGFCQLHLSR